MPSKLFPFFFTASLAALGSSVYGQEGPSTAENVPAIDRILGTQPGSNPLDQQNADPNTALRDALQASREEGPSFRLSDTAIFLEAGVEEEVFGEFRILNIGDTAGSIRSVAMVSPIDGLVLTDTCPDTPVAPGGFCDVAISYTSDVPRNILTAIVVSVEEKNRSTIDIPIEITVTAPPAPVIDTSSPVDSGSSGVDIRLPPPPPRPLTPEEIAQMYFSSINATVGRDSGPMTIVSLPDRFRTPPPTEAENLSSDLNVETIGQDPRYDASIPSTDASLPVNRDNILTSDRVIKAILDTPFSNVMCGKIVAIVESDVYSATSRTPLIEAGSRVVGRCGTLFSERAGIVWDRIITVGGRSISLKGEDSMTRDAGGLGGALGRVYRTPFDRYFLPIIGTFVDIGAGVAKAEFGEDEAQTLDAEGNVTQDRSARNEGLRTATDAIQATSQEIISDMQDVRQVLVVPSGTRIDIEILEDIYFKDERQVLRIADTIYDVTTTQVSEITVAQPEQFELVPFRIGMEGPVVTVDGQRFVVRTAPAAPTQDRASSSRPARPQVPGNTRVDENTLPTRPDTQATLDDLRQ